MARVEATDRQTGAFEQRDTVVLTGGGSLEPTTSARSNDARHRDDPVAPPYCRFGVGITESGNLPFTDEVRIYRAKDRVE